MSKTEDDKEQVGRHCVHRLGSELRECLCYLHGKTLCSQTGEWAGRMPACLQPTTTLPTDLGRNGLLHQYYHSFTEFYHKWQCKKILTSITYTLLLHYTIGLQIT